jgi:hypothetical protein
VHAHQPARLRDVPDLVGKREQTQAIADQHVMLCHADCSFPSILAERSLSSRTDGHTERWGRPSYKTLRDLPECRRNSGFIPA